MTLEEYNNTVSTLNSEIAKLQSEINNLRKLENDAANSFISTYEDENGLKNGQFLTISYKDRHDYNNKRIIKIEGYYQKITSQGNGIFKIRLNRINKNGSMSKIPLPYEVCPCVDEVVSIEKK